MAQVEEAMYLICFTTGPGPCNDVPGLLFGINDTEPDQNTNALDPFHTTDQVICNGWIPNISGLSSKNYNPSLFIKWTGAENK
jgi:hypothetical protein